MYSEVPYQASRLPTVSFQMQRYSSIIKTDLKNGGYNRWRVLSKLRVDDELKKKSDKLFRELGIDTTTAIRILLSQAVSENGFPFEIKKKTTDPFAALSEEDILKKLEIFRKHAAEGRYRDADDVIGDIRWKYGIQHLS